MRFVLVTGGAGFIGSHLVRALLGRGDSVCIVDNFVTGTAANVSAALDIPREEIEAVLLKAVRKQAVITERCKIVVGDVCDSDIMAEACRGIDVAFHQAAQRSVPRSIADPIGAHDANATGTLRLLEAARSAGVRKVINASSSSVYGNTPLPKHEGQIPQPSSPYAASKLAAEAYCQAYSRAFGLQTVSLRYFNVFGLRQDPASEYAAVIPKFIRHALSGEPLPVHGDGLQSRDFSYVENVVEANLRAAEAPLDEPVVLNIGGGRKFTLLDLAAHLQEILGRPLSRVHIPSRAGDVRDSLADISMARQVLGYAPRVEFAQGLRLTVEAMRAELHAEPPGPAPYRRVR